MLLSVKEADLWSLRWSKGSRNAACWGSEQQAEGWGHPGCRGLGTARIKAHWTGYTPNCFSHWSPDLPSCPSGAPAGHNSRRLIFPRGAHFATSVRRGKQHITDGVSQKLLTCDFLLFLSLPTNNLISALIKKETPLISKGMRRCVLLMFVADANLIYSLNLKLGHSAPLSSNSITP